MDDALARARLHRDAHGPEILRRFADLLAIPNVAADPEGLAENARRIRDAFLDRGVHAATIALPGAATAVLGRIDGRPGGPRYGVYAHYDGQPADPQHWSSPPFTPTLRSGALEAGGARIPFPEPGEAVDLEWRIYARGSADDRGAIAALLGAVDALDGRRPEATVVFLFEGEEEHGSPHLPEYLETLADRLAADLWLVCDGPVHPSGRPQVVFGVRGIATVEIEVFGPPTDLHSGHYGAWAPNPAWLLSALVASLRDGSRAVRVAGFSDGAFDDPEAVRAARTVPDPGDLGFALPAEGPGYAERMLRPLINVRGLRAGDVGEAARNVVPASAVASLDLRLVPGQDPEAAIRSVRDHVAGLGFHVVDGEPDAATRRGHRRIARVTGTPGYPGVRTPIGHPAAARVIEAVRAAGGDPVLLPSFGSSVPLHHFVEALGAAPVILPIANADNHQHASDENLRVGNFWYGIDVLAALLG